MSKVISMTEVRQLLVEYIMQDKKTSLPQRKLRRDVAVKIFNTISFAIGSIDLGYLRGLDFKSERTE